MTSDLLAGLGVERRAEHLGGQVEIDATGSTRHRGADRPREADADILWAVDAIGRLAMRPGDRKLVHLLVIALLQIDDRAVGRTADEDHREAIGRRVGQPDHPVEEARRRHRHADAGLGGEVAGDRRGVGGLLLMPKAEIADALVLREPQQVGDRDAGDAENRIDAVQLQRLHHKMEAIGHIALLLRFAHLVHRSSGFCVL